MYKARYQIALFFILLLAAGCAQVRSISGGEKDTTPPTVMSAFPQSNTLHFESSSFVVLFDEYIQLRDLQKELLVSPPLRKTPTVKVQKLGMEVSWDDTLKAQTTYIFQFGNSVVDVNESNVLPDFSYVFSTGDFLDSLKCAGRVLNAYSDAPVASAKVLLFDSLSHVFSSKSQPAYFARTNENGDFQFNYLRSGRYVVCAMSDENGNNHFDMGEAIDWVEGVDAQMPGDSASYNLFMSSPRDSIVRGFSYVSDPSGVLKFRVEPWMELADVRALMTDSVVQWTQQDTLFSAPLNRCTGRVELAVSYDGVDLDTLEIERLPNEAGTFRMRHAITPKMTAYDRLVFSSDRPIVSIDSSRLECYQDSVLLMSEAKLTHPAGVEVLFETIPGGRYKVRALPGWLVDDCGATNDTATVLFSTYESKELGSLRFNLPMEALDGQHSFQLIDRSKRVVRTLKKILATEVVLDQLVAGDYTAVIGADSNANGLFDPLQLSPFRITERNHAYSATIQVRPNWEVVVNWPSWNKRR